MVSLTSPQQAAQKLQPQWPPQVRFSQLRPTSYNPYFSFTICIDFNYCATQATNTACPTGSFCTSLSANFTYTCTCYSNYTVSGVLSTNPYIEQCSVFTSPVLVVLAIVIPIVAGIAILLAVVFVVFVVSTYT